MKRGAPLRRSYPKVWVRAESDKVTPAVANYVHARDNGCIAPRLDFEGTCEGRLELDHVDNGGRGKRGPSTASNLVVLCSRHHSDKTLNARAWRPLQRAYLFNVEHMALPPATGNVFEDEEPAA